MGRWLTGKRYEECFRQCLNVCSVLDSRISVGTLFQTVGAVKLKTRLLKFVMWGGISKRLRFAKGRLRDGLYGFRRFLK